MNESFFKYLVPNSEDKKWGLYLNVAGRDKIAAGKEYPLSEHPNEYYFTWQKGRVLNEYQLVYITKGKGVFENKDKSHKLSEGSMIMLVPGSWHRYKPNKTTGWIENYVGFNGSIVTENLQQYNLLSQNSVFDCGKKEYILAIYQNIFEYIKQEKPGYQQIVSGLILQLLGSMTAIQKQKNFSGKRIEKMIENIRFFIRQNSTQQINFQDIANNNNLSYSLFRRSFKEYTGISPLQYQLHLRILKSKELLRVSDKSIKEISLEVGFENTYYFSRLFKKKEGITASEFRHFNY